LPDLSHSSPNDGQGFAASTSTSVDGRGDASTLLDAPLIEGYREWGAEHYPLDIERLPGWYVARPVGRFREDWTCWYHERRRWKPLDPLPAAPSATPESQL
jgi:hypothetical protein